MSSGDSMIFNLKSGNSQILSNGTINSLPVSLSRLTVVSHGPRRSSIHALTSRYMHDHYNELFTIVRSSKNLKML